MIADKSSFTKMSKDSGFNKLSEASTQPSDLSLVAEKNSQKISNFKLPAVWEEITNYNY